LENTKSPKCSQCNSPLILISKKTEYIQGSRFPQTNTIYKCSNTKCQEEKDAQAAKRKSMREHKIREAKKRIEKMQKKQNDEEKAEADKSKVSAQ